MPDSPGVEALLVRLYLDRHIMTRLAVDLRERGFDVLTTEEAGQDRSQQLGSRQYGLLLQRMLRFLNHFTRDEMTNNLVHLEQFK
jgi:hypothetical protein